MSVIFYFSATGNSLYIAKELAQRLTGTKLIPVVGELNANNLEEITGTVGFIFPCHGLTLPIPVRKFISRLNLSKTNYIFAVVTRGGTIFRGFLKMNKILKKQGKKLDATFLIDMPSNDPKLKSFEVPTSEEIEEIPNQIRSVINNIATIIENRKIFYQEDKGITFSKNRIVNSILEHLIPFTLDHMKHGPDDYFYADEKCTGCGACEKVCLSQKIKIVEKRPLWQRDVGCFLCYACVNFCPTQALQIKDKIYMKSHTPEKGRYPHPFATLKEIADQRTK